MSDRARPTLWVGDYFARDIDRETGIRRNPLEVKDERAIWDIFVNSGIKINRGFPATERRGRNDVGIESQLDAGIPFRERHRKIWEEAGATVPQQYTLQEMLATDTPVVAKVEKVERGEGKYLLATKQDKLRMAAFALITADVGRDIDRDPDIDSRQRKLEAIFRKIEAGDIHGPEFLGTMRPFNFEEYIETPSPCYTSFRVVADAFGRIHSVLLLYSKNTKSDQAIRERSTLPQSGIPIQDYDAILLKPSSAFYIPTPSIVSNFSRGGNQINIMYPDRIEDVAEREKQRQILVAHGLDPDNPQLPEEIMELAKRLGRGFGQEYLYTGLDFVLDKKSGRYMLLEMNTRPMLDPEDIGLSSEYALARGMHPAGFAEVMLLRRIAKRMTTGAE